MKKLMIAAAVASAFAAPAALADYTLYGKAHIGVLHNDPDGGSAETSLESFASRIGIKGKTELTETLDAVYQWEQQIDIDGEDAGLKHRNTFLGLKGGFGTVIGGIHDTPMKQSEGKIDLFSDVVDIARVQDPYMDTQEREKDYLGYYSPKFNNMQVQIGTTKGKGEELGDAFSTALVYGDKKLKKTSFYGAIAYDSGIDGANDDSNAIRLAGQMKLGAAKIGAIWEQADNGEAGTDKQDRYVLSAAYKVSGKNTLLLQYAESDDADAIAGSSDITVGLSHSLAKSTSVYGAINQGENVGGVSGADETNFVVGLVHKFEL